MFRVPCSVRPPCVTNFASNFYSPQTSQIHLQVVNGFWCLRCLNDRIEVPNMIGSFASGATASLVAKNGTKQLSQPFKDGF